VKGSEMKKQSKQTSDFEYKDGNITVKGDLAVALTALAKMAGVPKGRYLTTLLRERLKAKLEHNIPPNLRKKWRKFTETERHELAQILEGYSKALREF